ncbi:unnamed protein product [Adineta ricciae]|uniref:Uncharacterized protein n=1 Tax=Adineta ricciae TaxID=249248 RepID=A0A815W7L9_ADIRI|nr:unnamed protein product [Adineta ricciae]
MSFHNTSDQLTSSFDDSGEIRSSRRTSSRISPKETASPRRKSTVRGGILKKSASRNSRKSSKGTPKSRRKENESDADSQFEMDYSNRDENDNSGPPENQENEEQDIHNVSTASADTVFDEHFNSNSTTVVPKRAIDHFDKSNVTETGRLKCSICFQDGLPFGTFRRSGMQEFLEKIKPGYRGPTRQTVRKRLDTVYRERKTSLKEKFQTIPFICLTTDLWMSPRRHHFLSITAHYHDENYRMFSNVISFRSFRGRHLAPRLKKFIINEIRKLNIESKIFSITTDNGSDIKSATSSDEFGIRFSCDAHNINRLISTGFDLWRKTSKKVNQYLIMKDINNEGTQSTTATSSATSMITTISNEQTHDCDAEIEGLRLTDLGAIFDEWINNDEDYVTDDEDGDYVPTLGDEDSDSGSDCSDDDNNSLSIQSQQGRRATDDEEDEENEEMNQLLSNPDELKKTNFYFLKKVRKLIKMINKSSILTAFVRNEVKRKGID